MILEPSNLLFRDWYDLGRGVAHLGQGVAYLGQVLSFLAETIETFLSEAYVLIRDPCPFRTALSPHLLYTLCHTLVLSFWYLFEEIQLDVATCPS